MRDYGRVPPIRDQDPWGTCWAFAAIGSLETGYITQYPSSDVDLSEMHLAYFVYADPRPGKSFGMPDDYDSILEQGGNADMSVAFLSRLGTVSESVLPYSNSQPDRLPEDYKPSGIRLKSAYYLSDTDSIKHSIMETGAVQISYYSVESAYYKSSQGTTFYDTSGGYSTNHAVLLVGWDDDFPRENFRRNRRPQSNGAWLVRNSWGDDWGNNGYFWMSYEQYIAGAIAFIPAKSEKNLRHYGYDDLGYCKKIQTNWCANIFKAIDNETLKLVGFQTISGNTSYDVFIYDLGPDTPSSPVNGSLITSLRNGLAQYEGYHTVEVDGRISAGHYFSVVMKSDNGFAGEGVISWVGGRTYSDPVYNPGETYSSSNGLSWRERTNNACIKAFTVPDSSDVSIIEINAANFPDDILRDYIRDFDMDDDGKLSEREVDIVKAINLPSSGLRTMRGIELLPHVVSIDVSGNRLTALNLSQNSELKSLKCQSQDTIGLVMRKHGDTYSVNLNSYISGDIGGVIPQSIKAGSSDVSFDKNSGTAEFTVMASSVSYKYDTGFNGQAMEVVAHTVYDGGDSVNIDSSSFPDENFRILVRDFDTDNDGWLSLSEREEVSRIAITGGRVSSLKGIEFFTALTELDCSYQNLSVIDLSSNTALLRLNCSGNQLTELDISKNVELTELSCYSNRIAHLDVSKNAQLTELSCQSNAMTSLDLQGNVKLEKLSCQKNSLVTLDLSECVLLTELDCHENHLASINVNGNVRLEKLHCYDNVISHIDLSSNAALKVLYISRCELKSLDLSGNMELEILSCQENHLAELELGKHENLKGALGTGPFGIIGYVEYNSQTRNGLKLRYSDAHYTVSMKDCVGDITRLKPEAVIGIGASCNYDKDSGIATFAGRPEALSYEYDTGYTKLEDKEEGYRYMDVKVAVDSERFITSNIPDAVYGESYDFTVRVSGDVEWAVSGKLPEGMSFNDGKITGTPKEEGSFTFTVIALLDGIIQAEHTLTFQVQTAPPVVEINGANFPDEVFRDYVRSNFDVNADGWLSLSELEIATRIDVRSKGIATMKGLEYLASVSSLDCRDNALSVLDLSANLALSAVNCGGQSIYAFKVREESGRYAVKMTDFLSLEDLGRVKVDSALNYDEATHTVYSESIPSRLDYTYDTRANLSDDKRFMAVTVFPDDSPEILTSSLPDAFENAGYEADVEVICAGSATLEVAGGNFPDGLRLEGERIYGRPTRAGTFRFTLAARNEHGSDSKQLSIKVTRKNLKITPSSLSKTTWGKNYSKTLKLSGLKSPVWTFSGVLPDGLSLNSSTGKLSGTVMGVGTFNFTVTATNGAFVSKSYTLKVKGIKPKLKGTLPKGVVGTEYRAELTANGSTPILWSIPNLPKGLSMTVSDDGKLCVISGTPSEVNRKKVSVTLTNAAGSIKKNLSLKINAVKSKATTTSFPEPEIFPRGHVETQVPMPLTQYHEAYVIAAMLGEIEVDEEGMYEFEVALSDDVPDGLLVWRESLDAEDDTENAIFLDEDGEVIQSVPDSGIVTVSVWLEPGKVYEHVIMVKLSSL